MIERSPYCSIWEKHKVCPKIYFDPHDTGSLLPCQCSCHTAPDIFDASAASSAASAGIGRAMKTCPEWKKAALQVVEYSAERHQYIHADLVRFIWEDVVDWPIYAVRGLDEPSHHLKALGGVFRRAP